MSREFGICGEIVVSASGFITKFYSAVQSIASGSSGDLAVLTPPAGQRVKLHGITSTGTESGISITIAGLDVVDSKTLVDADTGTANQFVINSNRISSGELMDTSEIVGGVDEEMKIIKDSGTTGTTIKYQYQFGE